MGGIFEEAKYNLTMRQVAEHFGFKISRAGFIRSPFREERTPSCKLYDRSYYDFGASCGGDLIQFTAAVLGMSNWDACRYLIEAFSLPISLSISADQRAEIARRRDEKRRQRGMEKRFNDSRLRAINDLHFERKLYEMALSRKVFTPFSDEQARITSKLQVVEQKLDVLCGLSGGEREQMQILREMRDVWDGHD